LRESLRELGYVDGKNITIVPRTAKRKFERLPKLAAELVDLKVDVIVAAQGRAGQAAKKVTSTTPIIVLTGSDLVEAGLVASLARPGGNVTGFSMFTVELGKKLLVLLKEAFPNVLRVGVLWHPENPTGKPTVRQIETMAPALGVKVHSMEVPGNTPHPNFDGAFQAAIHQHVDAFIVVAVSSSFRKRVLKHVAKTQLPAIYYRDSWTRRGGLMFYGPRRRELFRLAAGYVDRILKGAKPGDLPVQRATQFYLVINLKTAKKLGLTFSPEFLARADKIIR
jgi:putative ABC transport system substrate-binding protein